MNLPCLLTYLAVPEAIMFEEDILIIEFEFMKP